MKGHIFHGVYALSLFLIVPAAALADPIPGIFNTGQGVSPGMVDPHYTGGAGAFAVNPHGDGIWSWVGAPGFSSAPANSQWITQNHVGAEASQGAFNTAYSYSLAFNLGGFDPSSAVINFNFAVDNSLEVRLNGTLVDSLVGPPGDPVVHNTLHTGVTLNSAFLQGLGTAFLAGLNTLEFRVTNLGPEFGVNPEGLLVAISGTATPTTQGGVPVPAEGFAEPPSLFLWALMGGVVAFVVWRRARRLPRDLC